MGPAGPTSPPPRNTARPLPRGGRDGGDFLKFTVPEIVHRNGQTQSRTIHAAGNRDWAKFTIGGSGASSILIETRGAKGNTQMWIYDSLGRRVAYNYNSGVGRFSRIRATFAPPGTYYIRVQESGNNGKIDAYTLRARWTQR